MSRSRTELTACAGLGAGCLSSVLILAPSQPGLSLVGVLLLACVPAGAAVMSWIDSGDGAAQAGLILITSLTALALGSALMIWLHSWQPKAMLALAAAGIVSCAARLVRGGA